MATIPSCSIRILTHFFHPDNLLCLQGGLTKNRILCPHAVYENVRKLIEKNQQTGESLSGKYFWAADMLLVDEISRERIEELVAYFLVEGDLYSIFSECPDDEDD